MKRFSADLIYTLEGEPIENGIVVTDDNGKILAVTDEKALLDPNIERFSGVIVPGFVNAHCHLELSHLHKKIEKGTGLIPFIKNVIHQRKENDENVIEAMKKADQEMFDNGIVAVGDISNQSISANIKDNSKIMYHTFIEMIGFDSSRAEIVMQDAIAMKEMFNTSTSITPHAPYSLSKELLKNLNKYCRKGENLISIHNQENDDENFLFRYKDGPFMDFFKEMNINVDSFKAQSKNSLQTIIPFLPDNQQILFVHNTYTSLKDMYFTKRFNIKLNWCFCPNANLYIENKLPTFDFFKHNDYPITIGTDSLASNNQLCVLSEMKLLQKNIDFVSFSDILEWATINGAKFLGFEHDLGTIAKGKTPGLNLISNLKNGKLTDQSVVKKLI
jgi:cytosine/adenosine deaminase-related metal-dependent hydrolase